MLGILLPLLSLQYGAFCSAGGWLPCKVKPTSYLWVLLPFRLSSGIQLTNPLNLLRCFPMCVLKSLHNLSEEQLPVSWHTLYLIKPLRRAWRTAWLASQTHWVSLLETQQSTRVIFFFPPSDLWCGGKGIAMYVLERVGRALCFQLIAKSNFGRAFGNICHLTYHQCFLFFTFLDFAFLLSQAVYAKWSLL